MSTLAIVGIGYLVLSLACWAGRAYCRARGRRRTLERVRRCRAYAIARRRAGR